MYAQRRGNALVSKPNFMRRFDFTSRQYNALKFTLDGMESSIRKLRPGQRADLKHRIEAVAHKIDRESKPSKIHHLKRRMARLEYRSARLGQESDPRICFGSRKFFNAQHHLEENGIASHAQWQKAWRCKRSAQFFVLGSKDETAGCQGCVITHIEGGRFLVRLRLNGCVRRVLTFEVRFAYGAEHLERSLELKQAISYRFVRDDKGWRIFASAKALDVPVRSQHSTGCVGVDLNVGFVSVSETDRFGNIINVFNLPLQLADTSSNQAKTAIAQCVNDIVGYAVRVGKPVSVERLDFAKKKAQLSYASPSRQRMLSAFAYSAFAQLLAGRGHDAGIEIIRVDPTYSSKIGRQKYARRYGLSVHLAAAFVLARRGQEFRDRYVSSSRSHSASTCKDGRGHVSAGDNETRRLRKSAERSSRGDPRLRDQVSDQTVQLGGNPGRESSAIRVRPTSRIR